MRRFRAWASAVATIRARPRTAAALAASLALVLVATGWWTVRTARAPKPRPSTSLVTFGPTLKPTTTVTFTDGCLTARCHVAMSDGGPTHRPATGHACQLCHAPDIGGHRFPLRGPKTELCSACHDTGGSHRVQHKAMTDEGCLSCHDAHVQRSKAQLVGASIRETCARCHPRTEGAVLHAPYAAERCELCHDPHGSDTRSLLRTRTVADTCRECHPSAVRAVETGLHTHNAVEGSCLGCHAAHASSAKGLLNSPARDSCVVCHADVGNAVSGATVTHDPVLKGEQCVRCHDPHASEHPSMLRSAQAAVCLSCHAKPVPASGGRMIAAMASLANAPVVHGAVQHGDCSACHSVHGGTHARLLRDTNATLPLGPYDLRNYALCFSCHDSKLADAASSTQFRDGDRNLHQLHLKRGEQSRGCAACHAVHAGDQPRLIARTVNFEGSGWAMTLGFTLTPTGGRCGSGCHEALEYSRQPGGVRARLNSTPTGGAP